jgi:iron(III) transport system substrate-binding protein
MLVRKAIFTLAVAAASMLASGGASAQTAAEWSAVASAAQKEGKLVIYNGAAATSSTRVIADEFAQRYGIKVEMVDGRPSEIRERLRTEQATNRFIADVSVDGSSVNQPAFNVVFAPHPPIPNAAKLVAPFADDPLVMPITASRFSILVNTRLVKPADEPKSWADLLDPKWKGKILSDDPRAPGGASIAYSVLLDKLGKDYITQLSAQKLLFSRELKVNERRTAQGEYPIYIPFNLQSMPSLKGLPLKPATPREGFPYVTIVASYVKSAPHSNAARLFMNYLLEPSAQQRYADAGSTSVTGYRSPKLIPELKAVEHVKLMGTIDPAQWEENVKFFTATFK